jgi:hypothetical protein
MLPFTPEQFLAVFVNYNTATWPSQIAAFLLGLTAVVLLPRRVPGSDRAIAAILAAMWLWTGFAYHGVWFSKINSAAYLFALLFIIQGIGLIYAGVYRSRICFGAGRGLAAWAGGAFVVYSVIVYPLIGMATGHFYPAMPMFGVTPCPVTLFTFGMLLLTIRPVPNWLLVVPAIWSLIGGSAAIVLNVPQDWLLLFSGGIAVSLIVVRDRRVKQDLRTG